MCRVHLEKLILLSLTLLLSITVRGQITNCPGAQVICSDSVIQFTPLGTGFNDFFNPNNDPGCLLTEENESAWYYFAFNELMPPNSVIEFTIDPNGGINEDYDFAIYGPYLSCDSLGAPIRCSFANILCTFCPQTGLGMGATDASEGAMNVDGFVLPIVVQPGEGFYLLLDNWYGSSTGFQLTWGGSAAPFLNCLADPDCSAIRIEAGDDLSFCDVPATPTILQGSASGQSAAATYAWSAPNGETAFLSDATSLQPTLTLPPGFVGNIPYTLTVTDGACTKSSRLEVQIGNLLQVEITGTTQICDGDTTTLAVAGSWTSLTWSNNAVTPNITVFDEGVYSVEVTDASGCTGTDSITVAFYQINTAISGGDNLCAGDTLTLQAAPGLEGYTWSDMSSDSNLVVTASGTYGLTVTDANGCTGQSSVTVVDRPLPVPAIVAPAGVCPGSSAILSLSETYAAYLWSDMSIADTLLINASGAFSVMVTDTFGCQGAATINVAAFPAATVAINGDADFCENETTLLTATAGFQSYAWSDGSTGQTLLVDAAGNQGVTVTDNNGCIASASLSTTIFPLPVLGLNTEAAFCAGSAVTLDAGTGFSAYEWLPGGQATQTISVATPGTVQLNVTDANGCMASVLVDVLENPLPVPQISGAAGFCAGNTTTLSAPGGWSNYTWTGGASNTDLVVSTAGVYGLTVTDGLGCDGSAQITVDAWSNPTPVIVAPTSVCPGGIALLDAGGPYTAYSWTGGSADPTLSVNAAGTYSLTVTDANGCTGTTQTALTEFAVTPPNIPAVFNVCEGETQLIDPGNTYTNYLWSDLSDLPTLTVNAAGAYGLTVTDANGCQSSAAFDVAAIPLPTVMLPAQAGFCNNSSLTLDAGPGFVSYEWTGGFMTPSITVSTPGTYTVVVTDVNNCSNTASTNVIESPALTPVIAGASSFCPGDSTQLQVTPSFSSYLWSTDAQTASIFATQPGNYSVTVQDANGCTGSTSVGVNQFSQTSMTITGNPDFCEGETATLNATQGLSNYSWTGGAQSSSITVNTSGLYEVTALDLNGCPTSANINVTAVALPVANAAVAGDLTCNSAQVELSGSGNSNNLTYEWQGPGIDNTNQNLQNPVVNVAGLYTLVITEQPLGCTSNTASVTVADLRFTPVVTVAVGDTLDCNTAMVAAIGQANGSNAFEYAWYDMTGIQLNDEVSATLMATVPGTYRLRATDPLTGCFAEAMATVPGDFVYPIVNAGANGQLNCNSSTLTLNGTTNSGNNNYSYNWLAIQGNIQSGATTLNPSVNEAGIYVLMVENNRNGCVRSDTVLVSLNTQRPTANAGANQTLGCSTDEAVLDGTGSTVSATHRYTWQDAAGNVVAEGISAVIDEPGVYTLVVTNTENGCSSEDEVVVGLNEDRPQIAELVVTDPKCFRDRNGAIEILSISGGIAPYTYQINNEAPIAFGSFSNLASGEYRIRIEDAQGCELDTLLFLDSGTDLQVELGRDRTILLGESTDLEALLNVSPDELSEIRWVTSEGDTCPDCIEWLVSPIYTTTYSVYVQDENGCRAEDVVTVFVDKTRRVFIPNAFSPNNDGFNDLFMIFADRDVAKINDFKILDRWGELVFEQEDFQPNDPAYGWNGMFRGQQFSPQVFVYLAEIEFVDGEVVIYKGGVHLVR